MDIPKHRRRTDNSAMAAILCYFHAIVDFTVDIKQGLYVFFPKICAANVERIFQIMLIVELI